MHLVFHNDLIYAQREKVYHRTCEFLLETNTKNKKYLYGKLLTIFTMNFISILFLYNVRAQASVREKIGRNTVKLAETKTNKRHYIETNTHTYTHTGHTHKAREKAKRAAELVRL